MNALRENLHIWHKLGLKTELIWVVKGRVWLWMVRPLTFWPFSTNDVTQFFTWISNEWWNDDMMALLQYVQRAKVQPHCAIIQCHSSRTATRPVHEGLQPWHGHSSFSRQYVTTANCCNTLISILFKSFSPWDRMTRIIRSAYRAIESDG